MLAPMNTVLDTRALVLEPGSFAALMAVYEENYRALRQLMPDLDGIAEHAVSRVRDHLPLKLEILGRTPYTTTLLLTYLYGGERVASTGPDLVVRLYHDARVAEVKGLNGAHAPVALRDRRACDRWVLERKWQLNRFLERWLNYCMACGHSFAATAGGKK